MDFPQKLRLHSTRFYEFFHGQGLMTVYFKSIFFLMNLGPYFLKGRIFTILDRIFYSIIVMDHDYAIFLDFRESRIVSKSKFTPRFTDIISMSMPGFPKTSCPCHIHDRDMNTDVHLVRVRIHSPFCSVTIKSDPVTNFYWS